MLDIYIYEIAQNFLIEEILDSGTDPVALDVFFKKSRIIPLKLYPVLAPAAIILKQELINLGGDAAIHKKAITCKVEETSVVLLGTLEDYEQLTQALKYMPFFGLDRIREALASFLRERLYRRVFTLKSPWGREILLGRRTKLVFVPKGLEEISEHLDIVSLGDASLFREIRDSFPSLFISFFSTDWSKLLGAVEEGADMIEVDSETLNNKEFLDFISSHRVPIVLKPLIGSSEISLREFIDSLYNSLKLLRDSGYSMTPIINPSRLGYERAMSRIRELKSLGFPLLLEIPSDRDIAIEEEVAYLSAAVISEVDLIRTSRPISGYRVVKALEFLRKTRNSEGDSHLR